MSVVVKCAVKDQRVGPFCSSSVQVAINFFQFGRTNPPSGGLRIKSMDSSSTKDMDSLVISGGTRAAEDSSGLALRNI